MDSRKSGSTLETADVVRVKTRCECAQDQQQLFNATGSPIIWCDNCHKIVCILFPGKTIFTEALS